MQPKPTARECNVSLVGSHQARVTVNSGSSSSNTQPTLTSGLACARGVVITPLNPRTQPSTIVPIKAVCKSSSRKDITKTFTLRNINSDLMKTRDQLKQVISTQLSHDLTSDFDVGYYQASVVVSIRSPHDVMEIWNEVKKGVNVILWCDGLKESYPAVKKRKRSKKSVDSNSDSGDNIVEVSASKKKKSDKDEKIVGELKELHGQQYTPMQYRIWGEMLIGGLYSSKNESPNTSVC